MGSKSLGALPYQTDFSVFLAGKSCRQPAYFHDGAPTPYSGNSGCRWAVHRASEIFGGDLSTHLKCCCNNFVAWQHLYVPGRLRLLDPHSHSTGSSDDWRPIIQRRDDSIPSRPSLAPLPLSTTLVTFRSLSLVFLGGHVGPSFVDLSLLRPSIGSETLSIREEQLSGSSRGRRRRQQQQRQRRFEAS